MKDDFYGNFKTHEIKQVTLTEVASKKEPLRIVDPRPTGVGAEILPKRTYAIPFPPQEGTCFYCGRLLNFESNRSYDSTVRGYCNKLCRKDHETQLIRECRLIVEDPNPHASLSCGESETNWAKGWWENIAHEPIYIRDKQHLKEVCEAHGVMAKALMKPKSDGKGWEMR